MLNTRQISLLLATYGVFLLASGTLGFYLTREHSSSAVFNGSLFGALLIMLGVLHRMGRMWTLPASISATVIFSLTFLWRGALQWSHVVGGEPDKLGIAILLSVMALVSTTVAAMLLRSYRH